MRLSNFCMGSNFPTMTCLCTPFGRKALSQFCHDQISARTSVRTSPDRHRNSVSCISCVAPRVVFLVMCTVCVRLCHCMSYCAYVLLYSCATLCMSLYSCVSLCMNDYFACLLCFCASLHNQ